MASLARRNLFHDKIRLTVTLTGIIFAVVLVSVQVGLFIGFSTTTSNLIDHSGADLWITSKNVPYIEVGVPFSERKLYKVLATPGVAAAEKYIVRFGQWKRKDGANESVQIIGFDPDTKLGGPWNLAEGRVSDLKLENAIIVDRFYSKRLGVSKIGDSVEIGGRRARIVGFTDGIRTFTTSPLVFCTFKAAQDYIQLPEDQTLYILVKAQAGTDLAALKADLTSRINDVSVHTTAEFSKLTTNYWMFGTGAGITVITAAVLGLIVGIVVVAQTIYAATIDHLKEFGTLKAMGATNGYIYRIILKQAAISAVLGYTVGIVIAEFAAQSSKNGGAPIMVPESLAAGMFGVTLAMCVSAAMVSINKVTRIDPAMVFKG